MTASWTEIGYPSKREIDADLRVEKSITVYYTVTKALRIAAPFWVSGMLHLRAYIMIMRESLANPLATWEEELKKDTFLSGVNKCLLCLCGVIKVSWDEEMILILRVK